MRGPWGRILSAGGGLVLAVSFFFTMVDVFGPESPRSGLHYCASEFGDAVVKPDLVEALQTLALLLLILLPHLLGLLVLLCALVCRLEPPRGLRAARITLRVLFLPWAYALAASLADLWNRTPADPGAAAILIYYGLPLVLIVFGVPWLPRLNRKWTDERFVRRGQAVGALVSLIWFGMWFVMKWPDEIHYGLPLAILAVAAILAGALLGKPATRSPRAPPTPA